NPLILLIDRVTDVRNLGAIARSAEAFGVHALVLPQQESARINSDAVRASAGALLHLPICKEANLISTLAFLHQLNFQSIAITEKANLSIQTCDFSQPTVLILGSEGFGILPEILAVTQKQVAIPLVGKVSSLNVSVAAGITLYEIARQKYTLE
ncbi:MAG: RNA methyltransferase, partial [Bacteroidia bacterium]|nr:RNA methyltransferase [Bacteroidia bacterium]